MAIMGGWSPEHCGGSDEAHIDRIGNSQDIRLPKALLKKAQLDDEVELQAEPGRILILKLAKPRTG
jgi:antitoxin component of MazEF toxin-antitoxin module